MALAPKIKTDHSALRAIRRQYIAKQKNLRYLNRYMNLLQSDWREKIRTINELNEKSVIREENQNNDEIAQEVKNEVFTETTDEITEISNVESEIISGSIGTALKQDLDATFEIKTELNDTTEINNETTPEGIDESLNVSDQPISDNLLLKDIPRDDGYEIMFEDENNVGDSGDGDSECSDNDANNGSKNINVKVEEKEVDDNPDSGVIDDEIIYDNGDTVYKSNAEGDVSEDDDEKGDNDDYNAEDNCEVNPDDIDLADLSDGDLEDY